MSNIEIGKRLKELRNKINFTQTQFANKIGRTMQALQRYEAGKRELDLSMLILIEQSFSVNPSWLREGVGEMFISPQGDFDLVKEGLTGIHAEMAALVPKLRGKYAEQVLEYIKERLKFQKEDENALSEKISNKKTA